MAQRRETTRTYLAGVDEADLFPLARGYGSLVHDDYSENYLDFGTGGAILSTGHRDEKVHTAIAVQSNNHVFKGGHGEFLDWEIGAYAKALSERFPLDAAGTPQRVLFLNSTYEARLAASHAAAVQGVGAAYIGLLDPGGQPRDGGEIQDWVHQAKAKKAKIVADETLTGYGRTGTFTYAEQYGFLPDATILGPVVGAGIPMVAVVASAELFSAETMRTIVEVLGVSGAANPLACAAGRAVLGQITPEMLDHVKEMGRVLQNDLDTVVEQFNHVLARHHGVGLLRTLHLREPLKARQFREHCRNAGLLIQPNLTITPPLNCTEVQVRTAVDAVATAAISLGADMEPQTVP